MLFTLSPAIQTKTLRLKKKVRPMMTVGPEPGRRYEGFFFSSSPWAAASLKKERPQHSQLRLAVASDVLQIETYDNNERSNKHPSSSVALLYQHSLSGS